MFLTLINHDFKIKSFFIYKIIIKNRPSYKVVKEWKMVINLLLVYYKFGDFIFLQEH